jgi:peptidoglycan LD-endopeptidase LytH
VSRAFARLFLCLTLLAGVSFAVPAAADTEAELKAAQAALEDAQARADEVAVELAAAQAEQARLSDEIRSTTGRIDAIALRLEAIRARLEGRAIEAFMTGGGGGELAALLSSDSFSEFSDRLEFVDNLVQSDADLAAAAEVNRELLAREEARLEELSAAAQREADRLEQSRSALEQRLDDLAARQAELEDQLRKERQAAQQAAENAAVPPQAGGGGGGPVGSGAIQVCPVAGPNTFTDTFGAPRSGGRTHQGQDLLAAAGTPVVAVHDGTASTSSNSLGGLTVGLVHDGGGWTYYAHLSGYENSGHVSTGTVIGYVGSTGNAGSTNHLHFEYHPGGAGAAAVNPYSMLRAVC